MEVALMRRILLVLTVAMLMAALLVASAIPVFASANQFPHTCTELTGGTLCQHRVSTPSGQEIGQDQFSGPFFEHEGGAEVSGGPFPEDPPQQVSHSTIAPSGNFNTISRQDTT